MSGVASGVAARWRIVRKTTPAKTTTKMAIASRAVRCQRIGLQKMYGQLA
jgi:hypothetical protein